MVSLNPADFNLAQRVLNRSGSVAASEMDPLVALARKLLDHVEVQLEERAPEPPPILLTNTKRSTA